ncbi:sensor histidine kinase [Gordonia sinesedis]
MRGIRVVSMRLRTQVLLLQLAVLAVSLGIGFGVVLARTDDRVRDEYAQRALAIAQTLATDPDVIAEVAAAQGPRVDGPALARGGLQAHANAVRRSTGALFVVIANADGMRLAHPDPAEVGRPLSTDPTRALSGAVDLATDRGTLGESVRAKVPIYEAGTALDRGRVVGLVSVGVSTEKLAADTRRAVVTTAFIAAAALAVGTAASILLARRWRRLTLGLRPDELAGLVREQGAVLHSLADGVLAVDTAGVLRVVNDRARSLLDIDAPIGTPSAELGLTPRIAAVLAHPTDDPVAATVGERVVLVSSHRVRADGRDLGMVLSVVDRTDVERLSREVDSIRAMSTVLRAQRHETANRMHVIAGLLRHGRPDDALSYIDEVTGAAAGGSGIDGLANVDEPHLHAFLDAKSSHARERRVHLRLGDQTWVRGSLADPVAATTVIGNLVDNAVDVAAPGAVTSPDPAADHAGHDGANHDGATVGAESDAAAIVEVDLITDGDDLLVTVADSGPGITLDDPERIFTEGVSTKDSAGIPGGRGMGLALVRQIARRLGGDVRVVDPGGARSRDPEGLGGAVIVARLPGILAATADPPRERSDR